MRRRFALAALTLVLVAAPARAGVLFVTTNADSGAGSLRAQIAAAAPAGDEIQFDLPLPNSILLTTGELLIEKSLTITGPGADLLTISGGQISRVIRIDEEQVQFTVAISGLTIANGFVQQVDVGTGAGIVNQRADLTVTACAFVDNEAVGGILEGAGLGATGAGLWTNTGTVVVRDTTFTGNRATGGDGTSFTNGGFARGGAIAVEGATSDVTLVNVTITNNFADAGDGSPAGTGIGGGVHLGNGTLRIEHATIADNHADDGEFLEPPPFGGQEVRTPGTFPTTGGVSMLGGALELSRTLVTGNTHNDVPSDVFVLPGTLTSLGYSIVGVGPGEAGQPTDDFNNGTDPLLGALGDNGGPTQTRAIDATSPAFDLIPPADCTEPADQRGISRPQGPGCDSGAFELEAGVSLVEIPTLGTFGLAALALALAAIALAVVRGRRAPAADSRR
jgi:hypothetical protein